MRRLTLVLILSFFSTCFFAAEVSLREKIGQMLIVGFQGKHVDAHAAIVQAIDRDNLGGVILFDYNQQSKTYDKNIESPKQVQKLNQQLQQLTRQSNQAHHRPDVPLLISVDYEGGLVNRLHPRYGFPDIPSAQEIGQGSLDEANRQATIMSDTLKSTGFNLDYAPVLDVNVNPDNPIIGKNKRSFSADPHQVTVFADLYSQRFLANRIQCSYKHFPGHGSSIADSHLGFVDITNTWSQAELMPFLQLLSQSQHCGMVMVAHVVNRNLDVSGLPASLSYPMISGLLRRELQFDGVVITDDMQMKAISDYYGLTTAVVLAINAGVDMLIFGNQLTDHPQDTKELIDLIEAKVLSGDISKERIDEAYRHIMTMKGSI